ncbi:MAG: TSUP family transporter, partial [Firmicutes bacterium]|nr:TSUP family transporter [Bacillota bacterium]
MAETEEKKAKNDKPKKGFKKAKPFLAVGGGTLVGFINGFFGGGGGMLAVPLLDKVLKEETKKAHATAILVILPITIASAVFYVLNGYFELKPTIFSSIGVIAGGIGGA